MGTERVNTSAGDWADGVSSAGGVKSISSSKLSSNSCKKTTQLSKQADLYLQIITNTFLLVWMSNVKDAYLFSEDSDRFL